MRRSTVAVNKKWERNPKDWSKKNEAKRTPDKIIAFKKQKIFTNDSLLKIVSMVFMVIFNKNWRAIMPARKG